MLTKDYDNVKQHFRYHNNEAKASFTTLIQELIMSTPFRVLILMRPKLLS